MTAGVSKKGQQRDVKTLTNFAGAIGVTIHEHATTAILRDWLSWSSHELARERSSRLDGLHGQQLSHGIWNII